jgi:hypothetical protein
MSAQDFSARDKAVRHNIYASVRRREGVPHDLFAAYWRDVHATLCSRLPGLGFYVQQHFDRNHIANLWPLADGVRPIKAVLDGSAELGFANLDDQATFAKAGTILYGDEANFIGEAVAYALPNGSLTYVDRDEDGSRNGPDRLHRVHVYMNRRPGPQASAWLAETTAELAQSESVQKWKLHLPEPYCNERPAPPSPNVEHVVEDDRLNLAVAEVAFTSARTAREFFATPAFQRVLSGQAEHIEAIGAYLVTGFYTFVRDGHLTTAGLRGSRLAELIEAAGAANQLEPAVVSMFGRSG